MTAQDVGELFESDSQPGTSLAYRLAAALVEDLRQRKGADLPGRIAARARTLDAAGRSLPAWSGCFRLRASDIFVLSADPDSFDSRYMGPIDGSHVVGFAQPIWMQQSRAD